MHFDRAVLRMSGQSKVSRKVRVCVSGDNYVDNVQYCVYLKIERILDRFILFVFVMCVLHETVKFQFDL